MQCFPSWPNPCPTGTRLPGNHPRAFRNTYGHVANQHRSHRYNQGPTGTTLCWKLKHVRPLRHDNPQTMLEAKASIDAVDHREIRRGPAPPQRHRKDCWHGYRVGEDGGTSTAVRVQLSQPLADGSGRLQWPSRLARRG